MSLIILASNILDVPNFFWDAEPTLHPLYIAIREYLEIAPRIEVLKTRHRVFLDLAEMLSDNIADSKLSYQTWIIIGLIIVSIVVTTFEVGLRFVILERGKRSRTNFGDLFVTGGFEIGGDFNLLQAQSIHEAEVEKMIAWQKGVVRWSFMGFRFLLFSMVFGTVVLFRRSRRMR